MNKQNLRTMNMYQNFK